MNLSIANIEWNNLSTQRRLEVWDKLSKAILQKIEEEAHDELPWDILQLASDLEADDYFGTEGLQV
jgi:hypothetical protein